ncbi:MAG: PAS domain-containing protein [Ferrovibrio sp.]|uniref:PAS domain-containing protein n=1 Tax=Ferrovibrio sp. TaxID=1917215 RepID=UPI002627F62B|nr:PAS domain-containing protein [Ferrovibrio sp.]MCW0233374.1 PAS domain-containing protein [Ferrovibrio sp.]
MGLMLEGAPQLTLETLRALYAYWAGKRAGRALPDRADIDPIEMKPWLGNLMLVERKEDGDYLYRLYGSTFVNQFKVDMTGKRVNELPAQQADLLRSEYDAVVHSGIPMSRRYTATFDYTSRDKRSTWQVERSWERLALPLTAGGPEVKMLLVAAFPLEPAPEDRLS